VLSPRSNYTRNGKPATISGLSSSASRRDRQLTLTVTNPDLNQARATEIALRGASIKEVQATTLTAEGIHTHNSFENPRAIEPKDGQPMSKSGASFIHQFAPASVTRLKITLA
jgi:alpha-L-arabinofuranosidase